MGLGRREGSDGLVRPTANGLMLLWLRVHRVHEFSNCQWLMKLLYKISPCLLENG